VPGCVLERHISFITTPPHTEIINQKLLLLLFRQANIFLGTEVPRHSAGGLYVAMYARPQGHPGKNVHAQK